MSKYAKKTDAEIAARLSDCALELSKREMTHTEFCQWFMAKYNLSRSIANDFWKRAWKFIDEENKLAIGSTRAKSIESLMWRYKALVKKEDDKDAANVMMQIAKLQGIDINRHEIDATVNEKPIFNINLDDDDKTDVDTD